jgi:hypothetical protein
MGCTPGAGNDGSNGQTKLLVIDDVVGAHNAGSGPMGTSLGIIPSGIAVASFSPPTDYDDIAISNSRREDCQNLSPPCEGAEIVILQGARGGVNFDHRYTLTASNAVGLGLYKRQRGDLFYSLVTAGQGRARNNRRCARTSSCLPDHPSDCDGGFEGPNNSAVACACGPDPSQCTTYGCPPNERCECPAGQTCLSDTETGLCIAQDKQVDMLVDLHAAGMGYGNIDGCQRPVLSCDKDGNMVHFMSCACLDNSSNACTVTDNCGCPVPSAVLIGAFGATQLPYGVASGTLRMNAGAYDFVVPTAGGLDFVQFRTVGGYQWKGEHNVNSPVDTATIAVLDASPGAVDRTADIIFAAKTSCTMGANAQAVCAITRPLPAGQDSAPGCVGIFQRKMGTDSVDELADNGCRRFFVPLRPDGFCVADFNNDQKRDIAIASADDKYVAIMLGDGLGGFLDPPDMVMLPPGTSGGPLACKDVDGDGISDIVVVSQATGDVILLRTGM